MKVHNFAWELKTYLRSRSTTTFSTWIGYNTLASFLRCRKPIKLALSSSTTSPSLMRTHPKSPRSIVRKSQIRSKKRRSQPSNGLLLVETNKLGEIKLSKSYKRRNWKNAPSSLSSLPTTTSLTSPRAPCHFSRTWPWIPSKGKLRNMSSFTPSLSNKRSNRIRLRKTTNSSVMPRSALSSLSFRQAALHLVRQKEPLLLLRTSQSRSRLTDSTREEKRRKESRCTLREALSHPRKAVKTWMLAASQPLVRDLPLNRGLPLNLKSSSNFIRWTSTSTDTSPRFSTTRIWWLHQARMLWTSTSKANKHLNWNRDRITVPRNRSVMRELLFFSLMSTLVGMLQRGL